MFDRLSIRTKLIAIVAAPLAVIVVLAGLGFNERRDEAASTRADAARLEALASAQELQHELQLEALLSVQFLAVGDGASAEALTAQRDEVDAAADAFAAQMADVSDPAAVTAGESVLRNVSQLEATTRPQVDSRELDWTWAETLYRSSMGALPTVSNRLVDAIDDGDLAQGARSVIALGDYMVTQARIGVILAGAAVDGKFPEIDTGDVADETDADSAATGVSTRTQFVDAVDRGETQLAIVSATAGSRVRTLLRNQMVGGDLSLYSETVEQVRDQAGDDPVEIDPAAWTPAVEATLQQLQDITDAEVAAILDMANDQVAAAEAASRLYLAGALVAVIAALGLAIVVATSIARPVLSLTAAADRVATEQLPKLVDALRNPAEEDLDHLRPELEDLDVRGGREIAKLSRAVNQIQHVAVDVATEQATMLRKGIGDMFINLARRNQGLLDRQLEFIDELEAQEDDPDQLEHLFKLDHMATRMRRNAESLLVLAGAEPGRRRGKPVPLTKVALAAVGEIEHFARIDLLDVDECEIVSSAAADLAHLLSELMENATQFSPPDSRVEVVGHRNNGGGYTISITDQGIGMSGDQLADANQLLARPPLLGLTLARTLGFIVVGRLAARHGIAVRLVPSPAGGVTSIVSIPSGIIVPALDRVDLSDSAPPVASRPSPSAPVTTIETPSSILPPFEFYSGPLEEEVAPEPFGVPADLEAAHEVDAPATLADAVPTGSAFDEGLRSVGAPAPLGAAPSAAPEPLPGHAELAPTSRANPLFGPQDPAGPGAGAGPEPLEPLGAGPAGPAASPLGAGPEPLGPVVGDAPAAPRLFGGAPAGPAPAPPAAAGGTHLFRPPPADGPPPVEARTTDPLTSLPSRPASDGPRLFAPAPTAPTTPERPAAPVAPGGLPRREGGDTGAPVARGGDGGGLFTAPTPNGNGNGHGPASNGNGHGPASNGNGHGPAGDGPGPGADAAVPEGGPAAVDGLSVAASVASDTPELTSAGLVKRVPRRAGAKRAVPGSDGPGRAAATSARSPDEVRAMLSRFHSGKQAGQAPGTETSTSTDPKDQ